MSHVVGTHPAYELRSWQPGAATHVHVITASGELDLNAAPALRDLICRLTELGTKDFVVDLSDATFIDSTALGVLTGRLKALREDGGSLVLAGANPMLRRTIEISGLDRTLKAYPTLTDALARGDGR